MATLPFQGMIKTRPIGSPVLESANLAPKFLANQRTKAFASCWNLLVSGVPSRIEGWSRAGSHGQTKAEYSKI
jgi:hypothetical protein